MGPGGREGRAGDNQVSEVVDHRQVVEEAMRDPDAIPTIHSRELAVEELAQRRRGLDRNHLPRTVDQLERQATRARADFDDPLDLVRQPSEHTWVEPLRADKPVIELGLEPVEQLPGQGEVELRIAVASGNEPPRLISSEHAEVGGGVALSHLSTPPPRRLRCCHQLRPSSCRSPRDGPSAAAPLAAPSGSVPRTPRPGSRRSGCAPPARARRYSGCGGPRPE